MNKNKAEASVKQPLFFPDLRTRSFDRELMDAEDCDQELLSRTIEQFNVLNRLFSSSGKLLKRYVLADMLRARKAGFIGCGRAGAFRVIDVGCGGGDVLRWLSDACKHYGIPFEGLGVERDVRTAAQAKRACAEDGTITIEYGDALASGPDGFLQRGTSDYVISNHVMHHLDHGQLVDFVRKAHVSARRGILLNDLRRSVWAYIGYTIFTALFIRRSFAYYDGRLSIRRGFVPADFDVALADAGCRNVISVGTTSIARVFFVSKALMAKGK